MTRKKPIIGALLVCALAFCAFGAANAQAEGETAFKCVAGTGTPEYTSHCEEEKTGGGFITEALTEAGVEGEAVGNSRLAATLFGLEFEVVCTAARITGGKVTNTTVGTKMFAHGTENKIHYTGCTATKLKKGVPTTETCTVKQAGGESGTITTNKLTTTNEEPFVHAIVVKSEEANGVIAVFELRKEGVHTTCPVAAATVTVTGDATGTVPTTKRSHTTFNVLASANTLLANGGGAAYSGTYKGFLKETETTVALETS